MDQKGFTLIEIIMVLILLGIMGTMAGLGIVTFTNSFILSRQAADVTGKARPAMLRLQKEFLRINSVTAATGTSITYDLEYNYYWYL